MAKHKKHDWEAIEREYRSGQLSISEIAAQYGCTRQSVHRKAKLFDWRRDLTADVRRETANKVTKVTSGVTGDTTDKEIDKASDRAKDIIILHRKDILALRDLESSLIEELKNNPTKLYMTQYKGEIFSKEVYLTAAERSQAAANLANVQHKRIALERQAFNLNESSSTDNIEEISITFVKKDF